jgi:Phosphotransferase enzyme family
VSGGWNTAAVAADGEGHRAELTRAGQAAALALGRRLGLPTATPAVLSSRGNLLLHFAPEPVVARVATLTAWSRHDPFLWLSREISVASYVAEAGGPVVPPCRSVDPGPYRQDGLAISLWEFQPADPARPGAAESGAALARLHLAAADCPAELGDLTPGREQISEGVDALERASVLDARAIAALRAGHARLLDRLPPGQPAAVLHGDAHAGNLLSAPDGWRWIDLEETCRGPAEWDLVCLADQAGPAAPTALRAYAEAAGRPVPTAAELAPFHDLRMLEAVVWTNCMAHLYPARYRDQAQDRLARFLSG